MKFRDEAEAWKFWNETFESDGKVKSFGMMRQRRGNIGFEVRKRYANKRKSDGKVRPFRFVCVKEGSQK
jgi:hypothetical protein